ncbi:NADP-dependent oxidoreductase [Cohnella zeiphila]|uniref:NADP-dependent oxidoreductase n=1 Tax=Cohnella zeiphila TaxID=2761120 RepID=A0A7X0VVF3_9BACL|nr:NADP-dependent oxidoreductase [Cohnella zeiphila]MBB6731350.1 NADP-dependent oxidoreductase [Cohnella zeiphila]
MKAIGFNSFGSPDVLTWMEFETPQAGPGEVRVRVKAAGVQPADCAVRSGWRLPGMTVELPHITGNEFAGVVDQVGEGVNAFAVGAEVLGFRFQRCYAEYVIAPADQIVTKPRGMSWAVAGGLSASGQTALTALDELRIGRGDTVLINGAAGGVGTVAVQLAAYRGATVIGTAGEANREYLRELGAIPVAYGEGLAERVRAFAPGGVSAAFDAAGAGALRAMAELVDDKERIGTIVDYKLAEELGVRAIRGTRSAAKLAELTKLYAAGELRIHIRHTLPLEAAAEAHREIETGHGRGKIVLTVGPDQDE